MPGNKVKPPIERFVALCHPIDGLTSCIKWKGARIKNRVGPSYGRFYPGDYLPMVLAHRWAFEHFKGQIPSGIDVCHKCDTPECVNPDHLFVGTRKDNMEDAVKKGRTSHVTRTAAENHPMARLKWEDIKRARSMRADGFTLKTISKELGVSIAHASRITNQQAWKENHEIKP